MSCKCELSGVSVLYGNKVSHSQRKSRRTFKPNIQSVHFLSDSTGHAYRFKVAARTLRSVEKMGGLDQYLMKVSNDMLSNKAQAIKKVIISSKKGEKRDEA